VLRYVAQDARTGYGDAADRLVRALRASGILVEYRAWSTGVDPGGAGIRRHSRDPLPDQQAGTDAPTIAHLVPEHSPAVRAEVGDGPFVSHTVWETDRLPARWPALLDDVDRVIVPTEWNAATFAASGVRTPTVVLPHVVCDPVPGDGGVPLGLPADVVAFYTLSRWDQRKQPDLALRAFLEAFTADDPVALVLKTTPITQYPTPDGWGDASALLGTTMLEVARIMREYSRPPRVRVEIEEWTPERVAGLHARGDCFVSLSHGEGWDLGAFDAAAYGNPIVATGWGGALEWLGADEALLVDADLVPVEHFEPESYAPNQHWAAPRLDHAVERLREVARDLDGARRRAAPLRSRVLEECAGPVVVDRLLDIVPELGVDPPRRARPSRAQTVPRVAHFVFGLRAEPEPFHLVHSLAVASCLDLMQPEEIYVHCNHLPTGPHWERIAPRVTVHRVEPVQTVLDHHYDDALVARYAYAHHADFVRLDVLAEHGGLYADIDSLFVAPLPDELWRMPAVVGREADVPDPADGAPRPALSNALLMAAPGSAFVDRWRAEIAGALDGTWAEHSCFLAHDLAARHPADVHVEPQRTFHAFAPTPAGIAMLLERPTPRHSAAWLDGIVSLHLAAHLWWNENRRDVSAIHAGMIDEAWVRASPSTYATAARRFLPT
jgi:glycosyltransferase involved in cell wall biosynthesis